MSAFSSAALACMTLFLTTLVQAYPQPSDPRLQHAHVLLDAGSYMPGDDITNHGGITFSSNGLGTWHAGLWSSKGHGDTSTSPGSYFVFDSLPVSETNLLGIPQPNIATISEANSGGTAAFNSVQALPEPASWLLLLPPILLLVWTSTIRIIRQPHHRAMKRFNRP